MKRLILLLIIITTGLLFGGSADNGVPVTEKKVRKWEVEDSVVIHDADFVDMAADTIIDPNGVLKSFYEKLYQLSENGDDVDMQVSILHYGDSHIQGAGITDVVMRRLQRRFGNAGRGLLVPHRLTKSNEARDYKIETPNNFAKARLMDLNPETTIGIGGVGVKSSDSQQQFKLIMLHNSPDTTNYAFKKVKVFHDANAPIITAKEDLLADISGPEEFSDFMTEINLLENSDSVVLYTYNKDKFCDGAFYGFSVENGRSGVLYHAMGINGASCIHWSRRPEVLSQSKALNPDLIIISMGSNEAAGRNFIEDVFYREIDGFVRKLRSENPNATIMLTTPPEAMRRTKRSEFPNENFEKIHNTMIKYGEENGVAVFDLYAATGGSESSKKWVESKMMQRDRIHFTPEGYEVQGLLIYGAILNGYIKANAKKEK